MKLFCVALVMLCITGTNVTHAADGRLTTADLDQVKRQIAQCWDVNDTAPKDADAAVIEIVANVNPDGTISAARIVDTSRYATDRAFRSAADSALRAVLDPRCSPLRLPSGKYVQWKKLDLFFNPADVVSGSPHAPNPQFDRLIGELSAPKAKTAAPTYRPLSLDDFILDGKTLAVSVAKVAVRGAYVPMPDNNGALYASQPDAYIDGRDGMKRPSIVLLTDGASRAARQALLHCGDMQIGCEVTILGHATMCTKTTILGSSVTPCIAVEQISP